MNNLNKEQKEAVGLLSIGTFLEYFDLMIYVHMAVLLNELFFPKYDAHATSLLSAFAFCATFVMRPFGALFFGWLGDNIGRKPIVTITTIMMAFSCFVMAVVPTYAQIGIAASVIMTLCRVIQSISSTGEVTGSEIYLMEMTKPPIQYPILGIVPLFAALGGTFALGVASVLTLNDGMWRYAFWIGTVIAVIGVVARTKLRETPEFADTRKRFEDLKAYFTEDELQKIKFIREEKVNKNTAVALFLIQCAFPIYYYFAYIYCGNIFKNTFNYTADEVIHQNFILSLVDLSRILILMYLSYRINPLKILKVQFVISSIFMIICPFLLNMMNAPYQLALIQWGVMLFSVHGMPGIPIFYRHFPILQRFKAAGLTYSIGRAFMFAITSFGMVYLIEWFGNIGILVLSAPVLAGYGVSLFYFDRLEKARIANLPVQTVQPQRVIPIITKEIVAKKKQRSKKKTKYSLKNLKEGSKQGVQKFVPKESTV